MTRDNAYIFASSNLRAKEGAESASERLASFVNAQTLEALCQNAASVFKIGSYKNENDLFDQAMAKAVWDIREAVPDFEPIAPLLYKYDCTNAKLLIKCSLIGIEADDMLLSCGSIPKEALIASFEKGNWDVLPPNMKKAAAEAAELYKKTGEARIIDISLDCAAFADMSADAEKGGCELVQKIVSARADAVNILTALRLAEANADKEISVSMLKRSLVVGGNISTDAYIVGDGIASLEEITKKASSSILFNALRDITKGNYTFAEIEKIFDEAVLSMLLPIKYMAYGIDVAVRYLLMREAEVLNCRIAAAGLGGGISADEIRGRMRAAYV